MAKQQFIDKFRILSKELVQLSLIKKEQRPTEVSVGIYLNLKAEGGKKEFKAKEVFSINIELGLKMFSQSFIDSQGGQNDELLETSDDYCLKCVAEIRVDLQFREDRTYDNPILPEYSEEVVSLAYDDFRIILEDSINRTSYRGFYLPDDFREIANAETINVEETG